MFVGEQPGNSEDRQGHPFVGPAGRVLHRAMAESGINPRDVYVTNAVKHFKFLVRGKQRIHVKPRLIVALGATAAQALLGSAFRLTTARGRVIDVDSLPPVLATVHPSAVLRTPDRDAHHAEMARFIADLRVAAKAIRT